MPEPDAYLSGIVYVPRHNDLIPLVDTHELLGEYARHHWNARNRKSSPRKTAALRKDQAHGSWHRRSVGWRRLKPDPELVALLAKPGGDQSPELEQYALRKGVSYWIASWAFTGLPKRTKQIGNSQRRNSPPFLEPNSKTASPTSFL